MNKLLHLKEELNTLQKKVVYEFTKDLIQVFDEILQFYPKITIALIVTKHNQGNIENPLIYYFDTKSFSSTIDSITLNKTSNIANIKNKINDNVLYEKIQYIYDNFLKDASYIPFEMAKEMDVEKDFIIEINPHNFQEKVKVLLGSKNYALYEKEQIENKLLFNPEYLKKNKI